MIRHVMDFEPWDLMSARVFSFLESYGREEDFWAQYDDSGQVSAVISLIDQVVMLGLQPWCDHEELTFFLQMQPWGQLVSDDSNWGSFFLERSSYLMQFSQKKPLLERFFVEISDPEVVYDLLNQVNFPFLGNRENVLADLIWRYRTGTAQSWLSPDHHATATALSITKDYCFLGAVATLPEHRKKGIAGKLVEAIASLQVTQGRAVYLACHEKLLNFYTRIGFSETGRLHYFTKKC